MGAHCIMILEFKRLFSKLQHTSCNWGFFTVPVFGLTFDRGSIDCRITVAIIVSEGRSNSLFAHILNVILVVAADLFKFLIEFFSLSVSGRSRYHGRGLICAVLRNLAGLRHLLRRWLFSWSDTRCHGRLLMLCGILFFTSPQEHSVRILTLSIGHEFLVVATCSRVWQLAAVPRGVSFIDGLSEPIDNAIVDLLSTLFFEIGKRAADIRESLLLLGGIQFEL